MIRASAIRSPSPTPAPQLPVTGSNVPLISGIGGGLVVIGAVLFLTYRRRRNIKFVA
ncbi:LPXTG cell wall anchor domain-containing protein [Dactylosporangium roseum]|uniref:LPXTG cell wall anchor domain-containing protein n=1 Tax=Dactylosporangium roseum TaxID=47989 RepID=A0ABY5Z798_9ACTN|nr:LPXTG cell wall anchor domain-containing protein [Dactylosporangium roseum]UWZ36702.1 LPXTG cell wall anchor domain-containing protein [Dactylosporangium roseum]